MGGGAVLLVILPSLIFHGATAQVPSTPVISPSLVTGITSTTIGWTQPAGAAVDSYSIAYSYDLVECPGEVQGTGRVSNIPGNATTYVLTGLRPYADYTIMLSAENGNGLSGAVNVVVRTADTNPTTGVENFIAVVVSPTSISTTWSRIQCSNRNTAINRYVFFTYLGTTFINAVRINRVSDVNSYVTSNLRPRTEYELRVRADNLHMNGLVLSPLAVIDVSTALPEEVGFFVNGNVYPNNSAVVLETDSFGNLEDLWCVSDLAQCCSSTETGSDTLGSWTLPDGTVAQTTGTDLLVSWGPSRVALSGRATIPTGVFTCMIPDASSAVRTVYLYVYAMGQTLGPPIISYLQFNNSLPAMVCRSTGRLVESVQWSKDRVTIPRNSHDFEQNQKIIGFEDATYEYILSGTADKFLGAFSCEVTDSTGQTAHRTSILNGVNIVHSPLPLQVGSNESLTCVSETGSADIIWTVNGTVLASGFNVSSLDISFSPVNDTQAIHGNTFICLVNLRGEVINQTLEVSVEAPHPPFSVSIVTTTGSLVAGSGYSMTCEVRELYAGLTGAPSIQWSAVVENRFFAMVTRTTISDNVATSVATFDRQDTSDSGDYVCTGFLNSSLWDNTMEIRHVEMVRFQFPDPVVSITQSVYSIEGPVPITLNCTASVDRTYVNLGEFQYVFTWRRGTVALATMPEDANNLVGYSTYTTPVQGPFQRNYSCLVQVRERNGRLGSSSNVTANMTVMTSYNDSCLSTSISKPSSQCRGNCTVECSITVGCSISSAPQICWRKDNTTLMNEVSSVLSIGQDIPGHYSCDVTVPYNVDGLSTQGNLMKSSSIRLNMATPPPPSIVILTAAGPTTLAGSKVTLNCSSDVMGSFVWSHSSISDLSSAASVAINQDASGVFSVLTISSVLISHAGTYSCEVSAAGAPSTQFYDLRVQLSSPRLVEVTSLNLLGSSLTLTCSVGVVAMLEPGIQVQVQWTDSSGGAVAGVTPAMASDTSYTSQLTLANTEESSVGVTYTCTASLVSTLAFIDSSDTVSNSTTIKAQTTLFQVKLGEISNCVGWKSSNSTEKNDDIVNEIVSTVSFNCGCHFTSDHLTDSIFLCSSSSPNSVNYQAQLHGTPRANVSELIKIIEEEMFRRRMSIRVQFSLLFIENICIVPYGTERPCSNDVSSTSTTEIMMHIGSSFNVGILTGTIIAFVLILIVMGLLLVVLSWKMVRNKRKLTEQGQVQVLASVPKNPSSENREEKTTKFAKKKGKDDDIETKDCEAYGTAPLALHSSSSTDYEYVF